MKTLPLMSVIAGFLVLTVAKGARAQVVTQQVVINQINCNYNTSPPSGQALDAVCVIYTSIPVGGFAGCDQQTRVAWDQTTPLEERSLPWRPPLCSPGST